MFCAVCSERHSLSGSRRGKAASRKIPDEAFEHEKVAFLDWVAVTVAGKTTELADRIFALEKLENVRPFAENL